MPRRPRKSGKSQRAPGRGQIDDLQEIVNRAEQISQSGKDVYIKTEEFSVKITSGNAERILRAFKALANFFRKK